MKKDPRGLTTINPIAVIITLIFISWLLWGYIHTNFLGTCSPWLKDDISCYLKYDQTNNKKDRADS